MALEFSDKQQLKVYIDKNYPKVIELIHENIVNSNEENDPNALWVTKQIAYSTQGNDSKESEIKKVTFSQRKSDGLVRLIDIKPLKTNEITTLYSTKIYSKIGVVIGSEKLVGLIIETIDEKAKTALVTGYWIDSGTVTEKFHLLYDDPIKLKTKGIGDVYT